MLALVDAVRRHLEGFSASQAAIEDPAFSENLKALTTVKVKKLIDAGLVTEASDVEQVSKRGKALQGFLKAYKSWSTSRRANSTSSTARANFSKAFKALCDAGVTCPSWTRQAEVTLQMDNFLSSNKYNSALELCDIQKLKDVLKDENEEVIRQNSESMVRDCIQHCLRPADKPWHDIIIAMNLILGIAMDQQVSRDGLLKADLKHLTILVNCHQQSVQDLTMALDYATKTKQKAFPLVPTCASCASAIFCCPCQSIHCTSSQEAFWKAIFVLPGGKKLVQAAQKCSTQQASDADKEGKMTSMIQKAKLLLSRLSENPVSKTDADDFKSFSKEAVHFMTCHPADAALKLGQTIAECVVEAETHSAMGWALCCTDCEQWTLTAWTRDTSYLNLEAAHEAILESISDLSGCKLPGLDAAIQEVAPGMQTTLAAAVTCRLEVQARCWCCFHVAVVVPAAALGLLFTPTGSPLSGALP